METDAAPTFQAINQLTEPILQALLPERLSCDETAISNGL